jgi:hypothetical protein
MSNTVQARAFVGRTWSNNLQAAQTLSRCAASLFVIGSRGKCYTYKRTIVDAIYQARERETVRLHDDFDALHTYYDEPL